MDEFKHVIVHYGKPGMHWGVRLYQNRDGSLTPLGKLRYGKNTESSNKGNGTIKVNVKKSFSNVSKNISERREDRYNARHPESMTDDELKKINNRLEMEKRYRTLLTERANDSISAGERIVTRFLKSVGTALVSGITQASVNKLVNMYIR